MLVLQDLRKSFGSVRAVDGVSFEVRRGEVFGLLGPNGAGKSTTISMMVGLLRPDAGAVRLDGADPADAHVRSAIGVATQALAIYDDLTGEENLRFFGRLYEVEGRELEERVERLLRLTGLVDKARARVKTYSGGMKRRINLAAALVHDPTLVLLDEPTAGVDPQSRNAIFEIVGALRGEGRTIVYTTHYMEEAQRLCDRVAIMDRGRMLALDSVDRLVEQHGGRTLVRVRRAAGEESLETDDPVRELTRAMAGGDVLGVRIDRPDLEVVFLALTGRSLRDEA